MRFLATKSRAWILFFSALLAVLWMTSPIQSVSQSQKQQANLDGLRDKAWKEGTVGVIVNLEVPMIQELTAASARFSGMDANQAITSERIAADNALKEAIEYAAWRVFMELEGTQYTVNHVYSYIPFIALRVSLNALSLLEVSSTVLGIEEDGLTRLIDPVEDSGGAKGDTSLTDGGDLSRPSLDTSVDLIGAKTAWGLGYTGNQWYVAILDTGIRKTHQFFTGKNIVEACFSLGSDGAAGAGDCPNGNSTMTGSGAAVHYSSTYPSYDHGTHVSGIAAGKYGSLAGVAKDANIIAVQVFSKFYGYLYCGSNSYCIASWNSDTLDAMNYIYSIRGSYNIAAINMSLGGGRYYSSCDTDSRKSAIDLLRSAGIASAIATANNSYCGSISGPACVSTSVAVGASTDADAEAYFSNWHATMQKVFAPGSGIYSSTGASDSSYASWNGTSMATPHVAGAWALMKQRFNGSVTDLLNALVTTGKSITSRCENKSLPRIQVDKAIQALPAGFKLTIQSNQFGTTQPIPGVYTYAPNTQVQIKPVPNTYCIFINWSGDATGSSDPLVVTMDRDKTVSAYFRYIYAPIATGRKVLNRTFSQAEYINILSWQTDPVNAGLDITLYRIYTMSGDTPTLLVELAGDKTEYYHRKVGQTSITTYAIRAVTSNGREGAPALVTVQ